MDGNETLTITTFNSEEFCGYTQITTFFEDFSLADNFGVDFIKATYELCFEAWKDDYKFITELCMVLNWKSWEHANGVVSGGAICDLYIELYYKLRDWCLENLKGEELTYFIRTTD